MSTAGNARLPQTTPRLARMGTLGHPLGDPPSIRFACDEVTYGEQQCAVYKHTRLLSLVRACWTLLEVYLCAERAERPAINPESSKQSPIGVQPRASRTAPLAQNTSQLLTRDSCSGLTCNSSPRRLDTHTRSNSTDCHAQRSKTHHTKRQPTWAIIQLRPSRNGVAT